MLLLNKTYANVVEVNVFGESVAQVRCRAVVTHLRVNEVHIFTGGVGYRNYRAAKTVGNETKRDRSNAAYTKTNFAETPLIGSYDARGVRNTTK